jgi:DNA-binding MarR family transcriptional regulator
MIPPEAFTNLQNVFLELLKNYRYIYRTSMLDELEGSDLTFKQFVYLDAILRMNKPTYSDIAKKFAITKPSVSAIVNKLISLDYLNRIQSEDDRRVYHVTAGPKGSIMLAIENDAVSSLSQKIVSCFSEAELATYISLTEKINAKCFTK